MKLSHPLVLIALIFPIMAWGQAGEVRFAQGEAQVKRVNGQLENLTRGTKLAEGDTLITGASGHIQVTMVDQAVVAVRPNTELKLEAYHYSGKADGTEKGILGLLRGSFRSITGFIGQQNKSAYAVRTPTATIGIRGTDHEPLVIPPPLPGQTPIGEPGTYDKVNSGSTIIQSNSGSIEVKPNQVGFAPLAAGRPPVVLPQIPPFMRSTPPPQQQGKPAAPNKPDGQKQGPAGQKPSGPKPPPPPPPPPPPSGSLQPGGNLVGSGLPPLPPPPLPALPQQGTLDPSALPPGATPVAIGTVLAGGDLSNGKVGSGSGIVGDPADQFAIVVGLAGNPIAISSNGFNYSRDGAAFVHQDSATVGSQTVRWGVYAGGLIKDGQGVRVPQFFHYTLGGQASTLATLSSNLPTPGDSLVFSTIAGFTKPITESGAVGGNITDFSITLSNIGGQFKITGYEIELNDALSRTWNGQLISPQGLADFARNGGQNLNVSCPSCGGGPGGGQANGMAIGNPTIDAFISSYSMKYGTAGVTGSVVAGQTPQ